MIEKNLTDEELLDITGGEAFLADESLIFPILLPCCSVNHRVHLR